MSSTDKILCRVKPGMVSSEREEEVRGTRQFTVY